MTAEGNVFRETTRGLLIVRGTGVNAITGNTVIGGRVNSYGNDPGSFSRNRFLQRALMQSRVILGGRRHGGDSVEKVSGICAAQRALGVTVDGKYGATTASAAWRIDQNVPKACSPRPAWWAPAGKSNCGATPSAPSGGAAPSGGGTAPSGGGTAPSVPSAPSTPSAPSAPSGGGTPSSTPSAPSGGGTTPSGGGTTPSGGGGATDVIVVPEKKGLSTGAIVAGGIGAAALVGLIVVAATGKKTTTTRTTITKPARRKPARKATRKPARKSKKSPKRRK